MGFSTPRKPWILKSVVPSNCFRIAKKRFILRVKLLVSNRTWKRFKKGIRIVFETTSRSFRLPDFGKTCDRMHLD